MGSIERSSLGYNVILGDVYDARTNEVCHLNIIKEEIPQPLVHSNANPLSRRERVRNYTYSEKCEAMGVTGETQVSLLAKPDLPQGPYRYLTDREISTGAVQGAWIFTTKTKDESINFLDVNVRARISRKGLAVAAKMGTHIVQEISHGAKMVVSWTDQGEITYYQDGNFGNAFPPTTVQECKELVSSKPTLIGNGRPQSMILIPIQDLLMHFELPVTPSAFIPVGGDDVRRIVYAFEQFYVSQRELRRLHQEAFRYNVCVPYETARDIFASYLENEAGLNNFQHTLSNLLQKICEGGDGTRQLNDLVNEMGQCSGLISNILEEWFAVAENTAIACRLVTRGIRYIGYGDSMEQVLLELPRAAQQTFLLYFSQQQRTEDPGRWIRTLNLFLERHRENERNGFQFIAVDCDIHRRLRQPSDRI